MSQGDVMTCAPLCSGSSGSSVMHEPPSWLADVLGDSARSWYDGGGCSRGSLTFLCRLQSAAATAATAEQRLLPVAAGDEEEEDDEEAKNGKSEAKDDEEGTCRRAWPTQGGHAAASAFAAAAADPVLTSRVCPGHIDDSDYDSHRVSQYKQRKYLTISAHHRAAAASQRPQQQVPVAAAAARGPSPQQQAAAHGSGAAATAARVRRHRHHHRSSRKATRPSLSYTPTLRRLDEVEPTTTAATASAPEWQTSADECEDVACDAANSAQRYKSSTNTDGRDADVGADADGVAIGACRDKASSTGNDVASVVQEAERSSQFVYADSDSPIPSRVGRF